MTNLQTLPQRPKWLIPSLMMILCGFLLLYLSQRFSRSWNVSASSTMNALQSSSDEQDQAESDKPEPIDLTKIDLQGPMPPPDHKIFQMYPVKRPSDLSIYNGREGDTRGVLFTLTDFEIRLSTLEQALEQRRGKSR